MNLTHSSSIDIHKDSLKINLIVEGTEEKLKYFFYLYKDDVRIEKQKGIEKPECSFKLYEDGMYFVRYIIRNSADEDVIGETKKVKFEFSAETLAQYRVNYFGNSKILDQLNVRRYLNIGKEIEGVSIAHSSEEELVALCKSLVDNNPDSIIIDVLDERGEYDVSNLSENKEFEIRDQWVKFVKILREMNQVRVVLINRTFYSDDQNKKGIFNQWNYFYEIVYYPFYKYYHKLSKLLVQSKWIEKGIGEEKIKDLGGVRRSLIKQLQWKDGIDFKVHTTRADNTIYIEAQGDLLSEDMQYMFSLCKDRVLYERTNWSSEKSKSFELGENGIYFIQVSVKDRSRVSVKNSKTFEYFDEGFKAEYKQFLEKEIKATEIDQPLEYFKGEHPYDDFAVITIKAEAETQNNIEVLREFANITLGQEVYNLPDIGGYRNYLVSSVRPIEYNGKQVVLSGHCVSGEHFIVGTEDGVKIENLDELPETIGQFSAAVIGKEDLTVTSDFFNIARGYYYQDSKYFIIANRYHLLILLCKQMGINLELDYKQVGALLSSGDIGYGRQNIISDMNILGLKEIRTGFYWKLTKDGWAQLQNGLSAICNTKEVYHEAKYKEMLIQAKEEVVHSLDVIFNDARSDKVIVDLSGGLDTRTVYSGVTNLTRNKEKIIIHAGASAKNQDIQVATAINEMYHFPYDNMPTELRYHNIGNVVNKMRSCDVGTYYNRSIQQTVQRPKRIKLIGSCGEALLRPYWIRDMYNTQMEYGYKIGDFLEALESSIMPKVNTDYELAFSENFKLLEKQLLQFPYEEVIEKYNYFTIAFGEVYHGHNIIKNYLGFNMYMIVLSKQILKLTSITESVFKSMKLHMDFIAECNPVLGVINYESERYNEARAAIQGLSYNNPSLDGVCTLRTREDTTDWKIATSEKRANLRVTKEEDAVYFDSKDIYAVVYESLLYQFQQLMRQSEELSQMLGMALYYYITYRDKNYTQILQYYHKVTSVLDQLNLAKK